MMKIYTLNEHFTELKHRVLRILITFFVCFAVCYYYSDKIYYILLEPLYYANYEQKIIYTGLAEAFFTYMKLSAFGSIMIIMPMIAIEVYLFISPGLYKKEKQLAASVLFMSPILFWCGSIFVFYCVMPRAWQFFLSFETKEIITPIVLEARISEYLNLVIQFIIAFGVAFQLPIIIAILKVLKVITIEHLKQKRRLFIVIDFIIAGILTPPDIFSQFALAIVLFLLYESSILMCKFLNKY